MALKMNNLVGQGNSEMSTGSPNHNSTVMLENPRTTSDTPNLVGKNLVENSEEAIEESTNTPNMVNHSTTVLDKPEPAMFASEQEPRGVSGDIETAPSETEPPYSVFTPGEKRLALIMASLSAVISPLSSSIYLPARK